MLWRDHGFFVASARQNRTPEREGTSEHYPCNYALLKAASCTAKVGPNFHECVFWKKPYSKLTVCALFILQAKAVQIALLKFGLHWLEVHEMPGPIIAPAFWCFTETPRSHKR